MKTIKDFQKERFDRGIVAYNTNNFQMCIVIDGSKGSDNDPCSKVLEKCLDGFMIHTPPNRALIPTGKYFDLGILENILGRIDFNDGKN